MAILGIRCSNSDFAYAILEGTKDSPNLVHTEQINYPIGFTKQYSLKWFFQEISGIVTQNEIESIVLKGYEGQVRRKNTFVDRIDHEAIIFLVAGNRDIRFVSRKVKSTIAKDLGFKGKGRYLSRIDNTKIDEFGGYSDKIQEAILCAWSELD